MSTKNAALAQLDRVFGYEPKGQGFESLTPRQNMGIMLAWFPYFVSVFAREIPCELPPTAISPRTRANAYLKPLTQARVWVQSPLRRAKIWGQYSALVDRDSFSSHELR